MFQRINEQLIENGNKLGNKGKFLCIMKQNGLNVPGGIILDSDAYLAFVNTSGIVGELKSLLSSLIPFICLTPSNPVLYTFWTIESSI